MLPRRYHDLLFLLHAGGVGTVAHLKDLGDLAMPDHKGFQLVACISTLKPNFDLSGETLNPALSCPPKGEIPLRHPSLEQGNFIH